MLDVEDSMLLFPIRELIQGCCPHTGSLNPESSMEWPAESYFSSGQRLQEQRPPETSVDNVSMLPKTKIEQIHVACWTRIYYRVIGLL